MVKAECATYIQAILNFLRALPRHRGQNTLSKKESFFLDTAPFTHSDYFYTYEQNRVIEY